MNVQGPQTGNVRVHIWRRGKLDLLQPWSEHALFVDDSQAGVPVQVSGNNGSSVHGTRYRLQVCAV